MPEGTFRRNGIFGVALLVRCVNCAPTQLPWPPHPHVDGSTPRCKAGQDSTRDSNCSPTSVVLKSSDATIDFGYKRDGPPRGLQGCSVSFWKKASNRSAWPVSPDTRFAALFVNAFPGKTLLEVLSKGGGGLKGLGRETVAAYLNAESSQIRYLLTLAVSSAVNLPSSSCGAFDLSGLERAYQLRLTRAELSLEESKPHAAMAVLREAHSLKPADEIAPLRWSRSSSCCTGGVAIASIPGASTWTRGWSWPRNRIG